MTDRITTAIRTDAATSGAEGRRDLDGHLADFRAALLDEAALIAASDRSRHASEVALLNCMIAGHNRDIAALQGHLATAMADLNATREKLTTAEAHCNSFQHERDMAIANRAGLLVERDAVAAERDALRAERADIIAAIVGAAQALDDGRSLGPCADSARRDPRSWVRFARELADRVKASRAEADKLRARPVLTVERLAEHMPGCRSCAPDHARGQIAADIMAKLGAVTMPLPAQDRAEELCREVQDLNFKAGRAQHQWIGMPTAWRDTQIGVARAALASLGAPATPPSKPADVFAGVTVEELRGVYDAEYAREKLVGSRAVDCDRAAICAVCDALRVKLVAPVDPLAVARMISCIGEPRSSDVATVRRALEAAGIPVTPEAGK